MESNDIYIDRNLDQQPGRWSSEGRAGSTDLRYAVEALSYRRWDQKKNQSFAMYEGGRFPVSKNVPRNARQVISTIRLRVFFLLF